MGNNHNKMENPASKASDHQASRCASERFAEKRLSKHKRINDYFSILKQNSAHLSKRPAADSCLSPPSANATQSVSAKRKSYQALCSFADTSDDDSDSRYSDTASSNNKAQPRVLGTYRNNFEDSRNFREGSLACHCCQKNGCTVEGNVCLQCDTHELRMKRDKFIVRRRYVDPKPLGHGAFGVVISVYDKINKQRVAIKKVSGVFSNINHGKRLLREVRAMAHLKGQDHIAKLKDVMLDPPLPSCGSSHISPNPANNINCSTQSDDAVTLWSSMSATESLNEENSKSQMQEHTFHTLYIVTDMYDCDLRAIIDSGQCLTTRHISKLMYQLLAGLACCHKAGIVHRDIKPSNLLVRSDCSLCIADFGIARSIAARSTDDLRDFKLTRYVVTRWYRSPEVCAASPYNSSADIWSAGCVMAELMCQRPVFKGSSSTHQLRLISKLCKVPSPKRLDDMCIHPRMRNLVHQLYNQSLNQERVSLADYVQCNDVVALDLLNRMLQFHPDDRISAQNALKHPFFQEWHRDKDIPSPPPCYCDFESSSFSACNVSFLSKRIIQEIDEFCGCSRTQAAKSEEGTTVRGRESYLEA